MLEVQRRSLGDAQAFGSSEASVYYVGADRGANGCGLADGVCGKFEHNRLERFDPITQLLLVAIPLLHEFAHEAACTSAVGTAGPAAS